eukprot:g14663.t1
MIWIFFSLVSCSRACVFQSVSWGLEAIAKLKCCETAALVLRPSTTLTQDCLLQADAQLDLLLEPSNYEKQFLTWRKHDYEGWWQDPETWASFRNATARPLTLHAVLADITLGDMLGIAHSHASKLLPAGALVAFFVPDLSALSYNATLRTSGDKKLLLSQHLGDLESNLDFRKMVSNEYVYEEYRCSPNLAFNAPSAFDFSLHSLSSKAEATITLTLSKDILTVAQHNNRTRWEWEPYFLIKTSQSAARFPAWSAGADASLTVLRNLRFNARLVSPRAVVAAEVLDYDAKLEGWPVVLDRREPGPFRLQVALVWLYGAVQDKLESSFTSVDRSLLDKYSNRRLGNYGNHIFRRDEGRRQMVIGSGVLVRISPNPQQRLPEKLPRCTADSMNAPGRWVNLVEASKSLVLAAAKALWPSSNLDTFVAPHGTRNELGDESFHSGSVSCPVHLCTGDPGSISYRHNPFHWIFAPYHCAVHLFSKKDILQCTNQLTVETRRKRRAEQGLQAYDPWLMPRDNLELWMHVMGDSTIRELPAVLFHMFKGKNFADQDEKKFDEKDRTWGKFGRLRVSYRALFLGRDLGAESMWERDMHEFTRYNLDLNNRSSARPDVLVIDPGWAYVAWQTKVSEFAKWVDKIGAFVAKIMVQNQTQHPIRVIWHDPLWMFSSAHARTHELTLERMQTRAALARHKLPMLAPGIEFFNATLMTMARWDRNSYDGLHYFERAKGATPAILAQMLLNGIFTECPSEKPLELTNAEKIFKSQLWKTRTAELAAEEKEYTDYVHLRQYGPTVFEYGMCITSGPNNWFRVFSEQECVELLHGALAGQSFRDPNGTVHWECLALEEGSLSYDFGLKCPHFCPDCPADSDAKRPGVCYRVGKSEGKVNSKCVHKEDLPPAKQGDTAD